MKQIGRRAALGRFAIMALATASFPALARTSRMSSARLIVPDRSFILRREFERELSSDASILVAREWQGQLFAMADGARVEGRQTNCTVEAPEILAPVAEIERKRIAPGPFPAILGADGRIVDGEEESASGKTAAVDAANAILEQLGPPGDLADSRAFLARLASQAGAIISATPDDLFFPAVGSASEHRTIELPDGLAGLVTVDLVASASVGGLLDTLERRITTRIGDSKRLSRERWSLRLI